jgi:hypothetical protein
VRTSNSFKAGWEGLVASLLPRQYRTWHGQTGSKATGRLWLWRFRALKCYLQNLKLFGFSCYVIGIESFGFNVDPSPIPPTPPQLFSGNVLRAPPQHPVRMYLQNSLQVIRVTLHSMMCHSKSASVWFVLLFMQARAATQAHAALAVRGARVSPAG